MGGKCVKVKTRVIEIYKNIQVVAARMRTCHTTLVRPLEIRLIEVNLLEVCLFEVNSFEVI